MNKIEFSRSDSAVACCVMSSMSSASETGSPSSVTTVRVASMAGGSSPS